VVAVSEKAIIVKLDAPILRGIDGRQSGTRAKRGLAVLICGTGMLVLTCTPYIASEGGDAGGRLGGAGGVFAGSSDATGGSEPRSTQGGRATGGIAGDGRTGGAAGSIVNSSGGAAGSRTGDAGEGGGGASGSSGTVAGSSSGGFRRGGSVGTATGGLQGAGGGTAGSAGGSGGADGSVDADAGSGRDSGAGGTDAPDVNPTGDGAPEERSADAASFPGTNNPVLPGLNADPNIVLFDDTFFIYPTTDGFDGWGSTSFSVFSSTNLVKWADRGIILDLTTGLGWASSRGWAPSIVRVGGTYYFYFSADAQLGVATSASPTGPFKDALGKPLATTRQYGPQSIDPYAFIDDDGTPYLYFGSGSGGLLAAKLNRDMISFSGTPANISPTGASGTLEGSAMFKRDGTYYLVWSEGDTRTATYKMAYARSQAPFGPFSRLATILQQDPSQGILGPGGGTVLGIPGRDEYYLVYHRFKIPGGDGTHRETCIDPIHFASDGTIIAVKPTLAGLQTAVTPSSSLLLAKRFQQFVWATAVEGRHHEIALHEPDGRLFLVERGWTLVPQVTLFRPSLLDW